MKMLKLAQKGASRHGVLPVRYPDSRKNLKNKCRVFGETQARFSAQRGWKVLVRIWLKIKLVGDEVAEIIQGFEIPADRPPFKLESIPLANKDTRWVDKPPLALKHMTQSVGAGYRFAEKFIKEKADELQKKNLETLYPALERLSTYYHQIAEDAAAGRDGEKANAIEVEYRRRLQEEVLYACVKATAELIALESISTPIQSLKWQLKRNGNTKEVSAALNLYDGCLDSSVRCEICGDKASSFGISNSNILVCANCCAHCDVCGAEIVDRQVLINHSCPICHRTVCSKHALHCAACGQLVCRGHQAQCKQGCHICPDCIRHCSHCGEAIIWCKDHAAVNSAGHFSCRSHSVICIGCRENYPMQKTATCSACGGSICLNCCERCTNCGRKFCLHHIEKGRCHPCRTTSSQMTLF